MMQLEDILQQAVSQNASDILIISGLPVTYKIQGVLHRTEETLHACDTEALVKAIYRAANRDSTTLQATGDDDFSFSIPTLARFRVNALKQRGSFGLVIRVVAFTLPDFHELGIPQNVIDFASLEHGLILVTGPAGSGKSTTLACLIDQINQTRETHIITIEDPIEYLHKHKKSIVTQRELYSDTLSYDTALRAALRESPDIILLGEMRDAETIRAAVTAAETGHLVISTLHTMGAANAVNRIVDIFPAAQQQPIRTQLAMVLRSVISQQLLPTISGKLIPAFEIMRANSAVSNMIRESKEHQLASVILSSAEEGMMTLDQSIYAFYQSGQISAETAIRYAENHEMMRRRLQNS